MTAQHEPFRTLKVVVDEPMCIPMRIHSGDAGYDVKSRDTVTLQPGERTLIRTGVHIALPEGYTADVCPRSGLALKHGLTIVNAPGIVDSGYRGEIGVVLLNTDTTQTYTVHAGEKIAQLVIRPYVTPELQYVESLDDTDRGSQGFGSTGL